MYIFIYLNIYIYIFIIFLLQTPRPLMFVFIFFVIFTTTFLLVHVLVTFLLLSLLRFFFLHFLFCVFLEKKRGDRNAARDVSCFQSVSRAVSPSGCSSSHLLLFKLPSPLAAVVSLPVRCSSPSLPACRLPSISLSLPLHFRNDSERTSFEQLASVLDSRAQ